MLRPPLTSNKFAHQWRPLPSEWPKHQYHEAGAKFYLANSLYSIVIHLKVAQFVLTRQTNPQTSGYPVSRTIKTEVSTLQSNTWKYWPSSKMILSAVCSLNFPIPLTPRPGTKSYLTNNCCSWQSYNMTSCSNCDVPGKSWSSSAFWMFRGSRFTPIS